MKKNDWILIAAVLLVAAIFLGIHFWGDDSEWVTVKVSVDGEVFGQYPLEENQTIEINETNRLEITDGRANMIWADCPDKLCVHQKAISRDGESIICLPNKVVVSIVGGEEGEVDAVTN